jgi:hypothetical protein
MYRKISCFLIAFLLVNPQPSSAFLGNIDFGLEKLLNTGKVDVKYVTEGAAFVHGVFEENPDYVQKFPSINKLVLDLVQQGTQTIAATHLAYLGASIYLVAVVLSSYRYLIHSRKQLGEVRSLDNKLSLITEEEVGPIMNSVETLLNNNAKIDVMNMLNDRLLKIQKILGEIKEFRSPAIEGEEQARILQYGTGAIAAGTLGLIVAAPLAPPALGVCLIVGTASLWGVVQFGRSKLTYEETLRLLDKMVDKAMAAQKALTRLRTNVEIARLHGLNKLENDYQWNAGAG